MGINRMSRNSLKMHVSVQWFMDNWEYYWDYSSKSQSSKCLKALALFFMPFPHEIKSMPWQWSSQSIPDFYVMCILRTCVCSNTNDHPRMKGMRAPSGILLSVWIKLQLVKQSMSYKMLQKNMVGGREWVGKDSLKQNTGLKAITGEQAGRSPNDCHVDPLREVTS